MNWKVLLVACVVGLIGWVVAPSSAAAQIPVGNHYLCHQVKDLKTPAKFVPQVGVNVKDPTGEFTCDVKKPFLVCNPADPAVTLGLNYCCYLAKCEPKKETASYQTTDQWGTLGLQAKKAKYICNPCEW